MNKYHIYVRAGGLMEDPAWHWTGHGIGEGNTPKEAAINLFKTDSLFNQESMTYWGWILGYENGDGGIIVIKP